MPDDGADRVDPGRRPAEGADRLASRAEGDHCTLAGFALADRSDPAMTAAGGREDPHELGPGTEPVQGVVAALDVMATQTRETRQALAQVITRGLADVGRAITAPEDTVATVVLALFQGLAWFARLCLGEGGQDDQASTSTTEVSGP
jgi:hypothetical protein